MTMRIILWLLWLFPTLSVAQQSDDYWVEVLVYEHTEMASFIFDERISTHLLDDLYQHRQSLEKIVIKEPLLLVEHAAKIDLDADLTVIGHFAWRQPQVNQDHSFMVPLRSRVVSEDAVPNSAISVIQSATGSSEDEPLFGLISVFTSGPYLFTNVSLEFQPASAREPQIVWLSENSLVRRDYQISEIVTSRRILLTDIQLFDNESFGALVTVWPMRKVTPLLPQDG